MKKIFYGIGGGDMRDERMAAHYPRIVELARSRQKAEKPLVVILPTAHWNGTNARIGRGWMDFIVEKFEGLECSVREIRIGDLPPGQHQDSKEDVIKMLEECAAIFVLGGDTEYLLHIVRERGLVDAFTGAYENGTVFAGSSAGLIWFAEHCLSDSESFHKDEWNYIMLRGLGVLPVAINAHDNGPVPEGIADKRSRREQFEERFLALDGLPGLAVDEMVAIEVIDGRCKVRSESPASGVSVIAERSGRVIRRRIEPGTELEILDPKKLKEFAYEGGRADGV